MEKITVELEAKTGKAEASIKDVVDAIKDMTAANKEASEEQSKGQSKLLKGTKALGKGFKGVGLAMKAAGFAIIMKIVDKLSESLMRNQQVADTVETIFTTVGIVFKQISDVLIDVFKNVSDATGGFDALQKVLGGALSVAINLIVGSIQLMTLGVKKAQLAWEESFLGDGNPETIKKLNSEIEEVGLKLEETSSKIKKSGKQIGSNFLEAVGEVGTLAEGVANGVSGAIDKIDLKTAFSQAKRVVQNKKNYGLLESQSQRLIEQYDLEAETQRQIRDDERKSVEERIEANDKLLNVLNKQSSEEKKAIDIRISALNEQVKLEGESNELKKELYDLNTELIAIDAKVAGFKSEQLVNEAALQKEAIELTNSKIESESNLSTAKKKFAAEQILNEQLRLEKLIEINEAEKIIEEERLQAIVDLANAGTQAKIDAQIALDEFTNTNNEENFTLKADLAKKESELDKQKIKDKAAVVDALSQFASAESGIGKALLIVKQGLALQETLMDLKRITFKGAEAIGGAGVAVGQNVAESSKIGFPQNLITIAGAIAQGVGIIKSVKSAVSKTKASAGSAGASVPNIPTPAMPSLPAAFNVVGASDTNQLADAIGSQSQEPTRAYVVSGDVTSAQSMDRNIVEGASI